MSLASSGRGWIQEGTACGVGSSEIRRDAAGIDIGARRIHVAVDPERDPRPVREFQTFTQDLYPLADWLEAATSPG